MKVLQEGNKKNWGIKVICSGFGNGERYSACGAELMVEEEDVFTTREGDYTGDGNICYTIECPCCKTWTDIPENKLVSFVKTRALKYRRYPSDRGKEPRGYGD